MESDKISCVHCKSSQRLVISEQGCSIQGCLDTPGSLNHWFSIVYWRISINIYYAMKWKIKYFSTAPITRFFVDLLSTIRTLYILYKYMYVLCILSFFLLSISWMLAGQHDVVPMPKSWNIFLHLYVVCISLQYVPFEIYFYIYLIVLYVILNIKLPLVFIKVCIWGSWLFSVFYCKLALHIDMIFPLW